MSLLEYVINCAQVYTIPPVISLMSRPSLKLVIGRYGELRKDYNDIIMIGVLCWLGYGTCCRQC